MVSCYPEILVLSWIWFCKGTSQGKVVWLTAKDINMQQGRLQWDMRKKLLLTRGAEHWDKWPREMDLHPWRSSKLVWVRSWTTWPSQEASSALGKGLDQLPSRADWNLSLILILASLPRWMPSAMHRQPQPPETFCWLHLHPPSGSSDMEVLNLVTGEAPVSNSS